MRVFRIAYYTCTVGKTLADRVLKKPSGNDIKALMSYIGGATVLASSQATIRRSLFLMSPCPPKRGSTLIHTIFEVEKQPK